MENKHSNIGHNRPPLDVRQDGLRADLKDTYSQLFEAVGDIEVDVYGLPAAADIKTEEDAEKVRAYVQKAKAVVKDALAKHKTEKEEFAVLGKVVDDVFFRGVRDPVQRNITTAENLLAPYIQAQQFAAAEKARLLREEAERLRKEHAETDRLAAEKAAALEAEARAQAEALRAVADESTLTEATNELVAKESARVEQQAAADADKLEAAKNINKVEAAARQAAKSAPKGMAVKTIQTPQVTNLVAVRATMGRLGVHFLEKEILDALARAGKDASAKDIEPPHIDGVQWVLTQDTTVRAAR